MIFFENNLYNLFNMIRIILNNIKNNILKDIAFTILNKSDEYNFLPNKKQWQTLQIQYLGKKNLGQHKI